ncbi:hypothetical protein N9E44_02010 [Pelagibacterales bacterium]|nr:hypothetical protein [Pelagibacterales bacterium]MDB9817986.1 hypothetical protein [Pelagibacterales bacterium]
MINKNEYTFAGLTMEKISLIYGLFLILWGAGVSYFSASNSITSYIPSMFGLPIMLFAILTLLFPNKKKLLMHIVVTFGLIIFLGGLDFFRSLGNPFENFWADSSKLMMLITGFIFTLLCIKSFIFARKNK